MELLAKQENAIYFLKDNTTKELVYGGAAGGGKSALGCLWLIENCQRYEGSRWLMGRAKAKTLKETTLNTFFELATKLEVFDQFEYKEQKGIIKWNNGSEIILKDLFFYPSDPEFNELGSLEITGAFVDECNQIVKKAWDILKSRIRYKLKEFQIIPKILGTCNPSQNWVFSEFYKPDENNTLKESKKFIQALPTDNPHLPQTYLESLLELDDVSKQRLYYGNWNYDNDPSSLIDYDAICDMFTNDHVQKGYKKISADLAMQGRDRFIAGVWDGLICNVALDKPQSTGKSIELDLKELKTANKVPNSRIVADSDGLGNYLESYIKNIVTFRGGASAKNKKEYNNLKSECGFKLAEKINNREIYIKCSPQQEEQIKKEISMCLKRDNLDKDISKKQLIPKAKMKEYLGNSPDYLDMLIMGMYFEVRSRKKPI